MHLTKEFPLIAPFPVKRKFLFNYIDLLEKAVDHEGVVLICNDIKAQFEKFQSLFTCIDAAGGVTKKKDSDEILFIYRNDIWDLPKGKVEKNETIEEAAVREVEEETGLKNIGRFDLLMHTYHTYKHKDKRILKTTYWYPMEVEGEQDLAPQTEEGITEVKWMSWKAFQDQELEIYPSLIDVLEKSED